MAPVNGLLFISYISATRLALLLTDTSRVNVHANGILIQSLMNIHDVERDRKYIFSLVLRAIFCYKRYFSFHSDMKFGKRPVCELKSLRNWAAFCVLLVVALLLCHDPFLLLWWPQKPAEVG